MSAFDTPALARVGLFILFFTVLLFARPLWATGPSSLMIDGSTTVLPIIQKAAETYMQDRPYLSISISGGGSGNGIKSLLDGLTDIAMSSRDMTSVEEEKAASKNIIPHRTVIALDALVPIVHPSNPVNDLSLDQLKDIYSGRIKNWKGLGGLDADIVVISRDSSSGTYKGWSDMVMLGEKVKPGALLQVSSGMVVQIIGGNKKAIGYLAYGYLNQYVKKVSISGVSATDETIINGEWPILHHLYLFTNGEPTGEAADFLNYLTDPEQGQKIVEELGFIPTSRELQ